MTSIIHPEHEFLRKVVAIISKNLANEQFGVPDLADAVNMSRSNLLRKVKKLTGHSVSVYIRKVRLYHAKEMLRNDSLTVSQISYEVGFQSTSYFTKCFKEEFGFTPGDNRNKEEIDSPSEEHTLSAKLKKHLVWSIPVFGLLIIAAIFYFFLYNPQAPQPLNKSIAVLPFKNDSNDSSNIYFINGLTDAILDNLQKVEDLRVNSRTTVEKYRNTMKTIPEMAEELEVSYFVEGSGQKIGNKILLTVQLIEAPTDRQVWSRRYEREAIDIFKLQMEVARNIASEINAVITPNERDRIEKIPTENLVAYDYYLKGIEASKAESSDGLAKAIEFFKKAIKEDNNFTHAYAYVAFCYYYLDIYQLEKQHSHEINTYADKAMLLDANIAESRVAKAFFYMQDKQYELAAEYFEKALDYSPNAGEIHNFLSEIYTSYLPDTKKYLRHALQGIKTAVASQDSMTASYSYLHLSNALVQNGFVKESEKYVQKSLDYNPNNLFSVYLKIYINLAQNFDLKRAKKELIETLKKDTTRLDIIQEIAKVCYTMQDYQESWKYYQKFIELKERYNLDLYPGEDIKIAYVLEQTGQEKEAQKYYDSYFKYAEQEQSQYKDLILCSHYSAHGDKIKAMEHLKAFTKQEDYFYWIVLFLDKDPLIRRLSTHPDYEKILNQISENFWTRHHEIKLELQNESVL